jgi:hypothetical protein
MKELLQRIYAFVLHVAEAPESAPETVEAARELEEDIVDAFNGNYVEPSDDDTEEDSP